MAAISEDALAGRTCLSFEVRGPWGHFRRIEGNIVKQTYRIIPRTTLAGLTAGILGIGRDRYYDLFGPEVSAVAVEPTRPLRTMNMPQNNLSTNKEAMRSIQLGDLGKIRMPDPSEPRQQFNYEVLVSPGYRIDLWLEDDTTYRDLRETLREGRSYYVPSLGLSEHLAQIDYLGEHEITDSENADVETVDSTVVGDVDAVVPDPDKRVEIERSPGYMERVATDEGGGRRTTGYVTHAFEAEGRPLQAQGVRTFEVDDRTVMFS